MAYASRSGRATTSSTNPRAFGVCQRCGIWYNRDRLIPQFQWQGAGLQNLWIFTCLDCHDTPQQQLRSLALPADPVPVAYPLVEPFDYDSEQDQTTPYGEPVGLEPYAISPLQIDPATGLPKAYGVDLNPLSVIANGTTTVTVTCGSPHGLSTDDQVSLSGLTNNAACGFFSVSVTSATVFTYATFSAIPTGSLLASHARVVTALVGLPRGSTTIAQVG